MTNPVNPSETGALVKFSVLIGLVSTEDGDRILESLESLSNQKASPSYEVILADRRNDAVSRLIVERYPHVQLIACPPETSLPVLRATALEKAVGEFVVVTEDHCVPSPDWLQSFERTFREAPEGTVAVGGCVENGVHDTALDWATFLCEYSSSLAPVQEGLASSLPGMNVAYRRTFLVELDKDLLISGFWETTVHPEVLRRGLKLYSTNRIVIFHCKKFSFRLFARQRFIYSRYFAGLRFKSGQYMWRAAAFVLAAILPVLLLYRMSRHILAKRRLQREFASALPTLAVFVVIWSLGEMAGYFAGQGDALSRIE